MYSDLSLMSDDDLSKFEDDLVDRLRLELPDESPFGLRSKAHGFIQWVKVGRDA